MIFRTPDHIDPNSRTPLDRVQSRIADTPALNLSIMDISVDHNTLVVLTTDACMNAMIRLVLEKHWLGNVEVYNASELMIGGSAPNEDLGKYRSSTGRHLN